VPCSSGSAALTIALQAAGIGPGDEVIVPGLTWVACASAVAHLGAVPVLADIGPTSLCMAPEAVEAAVTPATRAVLAVHMYASRADVGRLQNICDERGLLLIEDASQAHGGWLSEGVVGSFGIISIFSFHQTKLLTAGEGGIAVTDDPGLFERLQKFRADGRIYGDAPLDGGFYSLSDVGGAMGRNLCMSEFHAAILLEGLQRLDGENRHRATMAGELSSRLEATGGMAIIRDDLAEPDGGTFYKIPLRMDDEALLRLGPVLVSRALSAELNLPVATLDVPLDRNPLYQPLTSPLIARTPGLADRVDPRCFQIPNAVAAWGGCIAFPHQCLLGGLPEVDAIAAAVAKLRAQASRLAALDRESQ
jgi:L-glutamine:scyllo-inosose aminotransferase/L-glutamine:2-deoxy-scyllo-inosose/3-amino-2,3-dideoxy-scyllo-inosose aminotransferase